MKKFLSFILTVVFALSCFNVVFAEDSVETYSLSEDGKCLTIRSSDAIDKIPDKTIIEKIIVNDEIAEEAELSFEAFTALKEVEIPEKLENKDFAVAENVKVTVVYGKGESNDCEWKLTHLLKKDQYTLEISGEGMMAGYNEQYKPAPWADKREQITELKINEGVTKIGEYAFYGLSKIETVEIPASVKSVGENAFLSCEELKSIPYKGHNYEITRALVASGGNSEDDLNELGSAPISIVVVEGGLSINNDKSFSLCDGATAKLIACKDQAPVIIDGRTLVPVRAVSEAAAAKVNYFVVGTQEFITIEKDATKMDLKVNSTQMFVDEDDVTIDVPAQYFGTRVLIPVRAIAEELGYYVKWDQDRQTVFLLKITLNGNCGDNTSFIFENGELKIFAEGETGNIDKQEYRKYPWEIVREEINKLTLVNIDSIGESAFADCSSLREVDMGTVKTIDKWAFYGCAALNNVVIPEGTASLGDYAFEGCTALETVSIPASVATAGNGIFGGCSALKKITYPGGSLSEYLKIDGVEVAPQ